MLPERLRRLCPAKPGGRPIHAGAALLPIERNLYGNENGERCYDKQCDHFEFSLRGGELRDARYTVAARNRT